MVPSFGCRGGSRCPAFSRHWEELRFALRGMVPSPTPKRDHGDPQAFRLRSEGKGELVRAEGLLFLFRGRLVFRRLLPPYVDRRGVEAVLEVGGVVFLDRKSTRLNS